MPLARREMVQSHSLHEVLPNALASVVHQTKAVLRACITHVFCETVELKDVVFVWLTRFRNRPLRLRIVLRKGPSWAIVGLQWRD